jgi:hypothetical protein
MDYCIISSEAVGEDSRHFSFKITITDAAFPNIQLFIGLCSKRPEGVKIDFGQ